MFLQSSDGSGSLSLRVKTFLIGIVPLILVVSRLAGHSLTGSDVNAGIDIVATIIEAGIALIAAVYHGIGWIRANFNKKNQLGKFMPTRPGNFDERT